MDFLTQVTLGAAVGQATMNRDIGNKAVLWGMLGGALPDLDMLAYPLMDEVAQLAWHRGISHSILFTAVLTPLLGWLIHRMHGRAVALEKSMLFVFLALSTHILLDCFTMYGTGVFEPFSNARVAFNNLFIIDPLYTLPLLFGLLASMFPGETRAKLFRNAAGIIISMAYVAVTIAIKIGVTPAFTRALEQQDIAYTRLTTAPTAFNCLLWRGIAEDAGGYWIGYRSVFDSGSQVTLWRVPRNEQLLAGLGDERAVRMLRWFSDGWYSVSRDERGLLIHDLRFGDYDGAVPGNSFGLGIPRKLDFIFSFRLVDAPDNKGNRYTFERTEFEFPHIGSMLELLWTRIRGI
jgi:inner membrane protein